MNDQVENTEVSQETAEAEGSTVAVEVIKQKGKKAKAAAQTDVILDTAHEFENLTKEKAEELAHRLVDDEGSNVFKLGGVFSVIKSNGWFEGFKDFKSYVAEVYGIEYRKAQYCINIYDKLVQEQISWDQVKVLNSWTKLLILVPVLTAENVAMWVEKALTSNCDTLKALVKQALATGSEGEEDKTPVTSEVVKLAFTVHIDQKEVIREALDKAKGETNTEFDTVALTNICTGYLGGSVTAATPTPLDLRTAMKAVSWKEALEIFAELFPTVNLSVEVEE